MDIEGTRERVCKTDAHAYAEPKKETPKRLGMIMNGLKWIITNPAIPQLGA